MEINSFKKKFADNHVNVYTLGFKESCEKNIKKINNEYIFRSEKSCFLLKKGVIGIYIFLQNIFPCGIFIILPFKQTNGLPAPQFC